MISIRNESLKDVDAREALLDLCLGDERFAKPSARLREGRQPAEGLSFVACHNKSVVGTVRLWDVSAGAGRPALLLGPLAVRADLRNRGIGSALMNYALDEARTLGHEAVLLVGDQAYYGRFGFSTQQTDNLWLVGRYDPKRFLGCELRAGALEGAEGLVLATGRMLPRPSYRGRTARAPRLHVMQRAA
jgi:predicted N-acetyltransferase YhbS